MNFYISGTSGSGKSILAKYLVKRFKLTHIELDAFCFGSHWVKRSEDEFVKNVAAEMAKGPWVICGNYKEILAPAFEKVDHLIWLDYSLPRIFWRVIKCTFRRLIMKKKCCGKILKRQHDNCIHIIWL